MGENSSIEWTDATWNPIVGCSIVSPGCTNCYAMKLAGRLLDHPKSHYSGTTKRVNGNTVWTGKIALAPDHIIVAPLSWRKPKRIFVNSMGDLFHEDVPDEWIDRVFAVMAIAPRHTFQVLTKRAERMREYFAKREKGDPWAEAADAIANIRGLEDHPFVLEPRDLPLPNVWLGVSAEDQTRADERIPHLLQTPAAVRFVSLEPLLGEIDLNDIPWPKGRPSFPETDDISEGRTALRLIEGTRLDWIICGGESGPKARPMHIEWARSIVQQVRTAGTAVFVKQLGSNPVVLADPTTGLTQQVPLRARAGADPSEWPEDLRVRQFPGDL